MTPGLIIDDEEYNTTIGVEVDGDINGAWMTVKVRAIDSNKEIGLAFPRSHWHAFKAFIDAELADYDARRKVIGFDNT